MESSSKTPLQQLKECWLNIPRSYRYFIKYLVAVWKLCKKVFPCLETIAEKIGFSKSTVNRAKNFFFSIGVLVYKKTAYTSNTYFINEEVLKINFKNQKWHFTYVNEPIREPVFNVANNKKIYVHDVPLHKAKKEEQNWLEKLPQYLKCNFMKCFDSNYAWIFKKVSEYDLAMAFEDLKWYASQPKGQGLSKERCAKLYFTLLNERRKGKNEPARC